MGSLLIPVAFFAGAALAQDGLSPEETMKVLKEVRALQERSAELLDASGQRQIVEKIGRLLERSEGNQKDAVDKLAEILRQARSAGWPQAGSLERPAPDRSLRPPPSSDGALTPYAPRRSRGAANLFVSRGHRTGEWGPLPARLREAFLTGKRSLDDFPPEYQQPLKEYFEKLLDEK